MKKIVWILLFLLFTQLGGGQLRAQDISLNGSWDLQFFPQTREAVVDPAQLQALKAKRVPATVPGNVELDLLRAGLIEDPMIGNNIYSLPKYEGYQWCYSRSFASPAINEDEEVYLFFGGIDCIAEVWLNGKHLGSVNNMFIEHRFDITDFLQKNGENFLQVLIRSAVMEAQRYSLGTFSIGNFAAAESAFIRKAPHMYGWDIMPRLVSAGLWRDVKLKVVNNTRIVNTHWMTSNIDLNNRRARLFLDLQMKIPFKQLDKTHAVVTLKRNNKIVHKQEILITSHAFRHVVELDNVDFWWPRGFGEPALYDAEVKLVDVSGKILSHKMDRVGVRTVKLDMTDIHDAPDNLGRFNFVVNGERVFIRGTNWVPIDALHSRDVSLLDDAVQLMVEANCNMVRCWGGNVYEDHRFFDLCDKNGIMVWQDFAMGCTFYPQREEFAKAIEQEAVAIVTKLRNHPSLVLWSGNNENDVALRWSLIHFNIDPNRDVISRVVLPRVIYEMDPTRDFLPSSPYYSEAVYQRGSVEDLLPENHLWGPRGYYKDDFYTQANARFVSEIGYHGCPNRSSLEKMFTKESVNPWFEGKVGLWNDEWMTKAVRIFPHTPKQGGRNDLMTSQVKILFGSVPENLDDFILASQSVQAEAMKYFVEMWRSNKPERSGIIWWNIRDGWPILSDAVTDYYNSKKMAFYFLKNVQHNVCLFINDAKEGHYPLVAVNDTRKNARGNVEVTDVETGERIYSGDFAIEANDRIEITSLPERDGQGIMLIRYKVDGIQYANHYLYGNPPFDLAVYKENLKKTNIYNLK